MKRVKNYDWLPAAADAQETSAFFAGAGMAEDYKVMPIYRGGTLSGYARSVSYTHLDVYKRQALPLRQRPVPSACGMSSIKG